MRKMHQPANKLTIKKQKKMPNKTRWNKRLKIYNAVLNWQTSREKSIAGRTT